VNWDASRDNNPGPRPKAAKITHEDPSTLKDKGYCQLGRICAIYPTTAPKQIPDPGITEPLADMLLSAAAGYGGDLVHVFPWKENKLHCEPLRKVVCTQWVASHNPPNAYGLPTGPALRCIASHVDPLDHMDIREGDPTHTLEYVSQSPCRTWAITTFGTVWRQGPEGCIDNPPAEHETHNCAGDNDFYNHRY
jgi:hypothetical protein